MWLPGRWWHSAAMTEPRAPAGTATDNPETGNESDNAWLRARRDAIIETLNGLAAAKGVERPELALRLGWRPARLTRALSGKENISIATLAQITQALGADFEVVIRDAAEAIAAADPGPPEDALSPGQRTLALAGRYAGMLLGISGVIYLVLQNLAPEAVSPALGALLGAALFALARAQWQLWLARRDIRGLKRYIRQCKN